MRNNGFSLVELMVVVAIILALPAQAAEYSAVATCTPSSHKLVVGLENTSATISEIEMYNASSIFVSTSFTEVEDTSGEPHTVTISSSDQTKMSSAGFSMSSDTTFSLVMSNSDVWSVTCE